MGTPYKWLCLEKKNKEKMQALLQLGDTCTPKVLSPRSEDCWFEGSHKLGNKAWWDLNPDTTIMPLAMHMWPEGCAIFGITHQIPLHLPFNAFQWLSYYTSIAQLPVS